MRVLIIVFLVIVANQMSAAEPLAKDEYVQRFDTNRCASDIPTKCQEFIERFYRLARPSRFSFQEIYRRANWIFQSDERQRILYDYNDTSSTERITSGFEVSANSCTEFRKFSIYRTENVERNTKYREIPHIVLNMLRSDCSQFEIVMKDISGRDVSIQEADCVPSKEQLKKYGRNLFDACYAIWGIDMMRILNTQTNDCVECSSTYQAWNEDVGNVVKQITTQVNLGLYEAEKEEEQSNSIDFQRNLRMYRQQLDQTVEQQFFIDLLDNLMKKLPQEEIYRLIVEYGNKTRAPNLRAIWIKRLVDLRYTKFYNLGVNTTTRYTERKAELERLLQREIDRTDLGHKEASALTDMILERTAEERSTQSFHLQEENLLKLIAKMEPVTTFEAEGGQAEIAYFINSTFLDSMSTSDENRQSIIRLLNAADNPKHYWMVRNTIHKSLFEYNLIEYMNEPTKEKFDAIVKSGKVIRNAPTNDLLEDRLKQFKRENPRLSKEAKAILKFY